jgi:hypothetical protein
MIAVLGGDDDGHTAERGRQVAIELSQREVGVYDVGFDVADQAHERCKAEGVKLSAETQSMNGNSSRTKIGRQLAASTPVRHHDLPSACSEAAPQRKDMAFGTTPVDASGD